VSLDRYAASNPAGVYPLECIEIAHPSWSLQERRVMQMADCTVTIDGGPMLFRGYGDSEAGAWAAAHPATDDQALAQRQIALDDVDKALWSKIEDVRGSVDKVTCRIFLFASTALAAPLYAETLSVEAAAFDGGMLTLTARTTDAGNRRFGRILHTLANTPGLRGRKA
jgi:hypothetical protein